MKLFNLQRKIAKLAKQKAIAGLYNKIRELNGEIIENNKQNILIYMYFVKENESDEIHANRIKELEKIAKVLNLQFDCVGFIDDIPEDDE